MGHIKADGIFCTICGHYPDRCTGTQRALTKPQIAQNQRRAQRGEAVIAFYVAEHGGDADYAVRDIVADLVHAQFSVDYEAATFAVNSGLDAFSRELRGDDR